MRAKVICSLQYSAQEVGTVSKWKEMFVMTGLVGRPVSSPLEFTVITLAWLSICGVLLC